MDQAELRSYLERLSDSLDIGNREMLQARLESLASVYKPIKVKAASVTIDAASSMVFPGLRIYGTDFTPVLGIFPPRHQFLPPFFSPFEQNSFLRFGKIPCQYTRISDRY